MPVAICSIPSCSAYSVFIEVFGKQISKLLELLEKQIIHQFSEYSFHGCIGRWHSRLSAFSIPAKCPNTTHSQEAESIVNRNILDTCQWDSYFCFLFSSIDCDHPASTEISWARYVNNKEDRCFASFYIFYPDFFHFYFVRPPFLAYAIFIYRLYFSGRLTIYIWCIYAYIVEW